PRKVTIRKLEIKKIDLPDILFYLECSKGTYVRQLAEDIGRILGCGACISKIERTKVGRFDIENAKSVEEVNESHIRSTI
ncbi:MAG: tRNA pseudouridine(55) synthase TruB, partial [Candidatus Omnitrophica bacterium]|nr:tRNA pseudouridine(55) synthase TruB [Candidatus Omnitrophota bacterium]